MRITFFTWVQVPGKMPQFEVNKKVHVLAQFADNIIDSYTSHAWRLFH